MYEKLYGADAARFLAVVRPVVTELSRTASRYSFMNPTTFTQLCERDFKQGMKVYWEEMLARAHLAGATSMIRSYRWCEGMTSAYESNLFLPFCASFRALLESAADSYHALNGVAITLAENHKIIEEALAGRCEVACISNELEDTLIHFAYARKPPKGVEVPASHIAKTVADYLKPLKGAPSGDIKELYAELCQFTHPAAHSVHYMLAPEDDDESFVFTAHIDKERIEQYAKDHQSFFLYLFMLAFNAPVLVLKILRSFEIPSFHVRFLESVDLGGIPAWQRIEKLLNRGR